MCLHFLMGNALVENNEYSSQLSQQATRIRRRRWGQALWGHGGRSQNTAADSDRSNKRRNRRSNIRRRRSPQLPRTSYTPVVKLSASVRKIRPSPAAFGRNVARRKRQVFALTVRRSPSDPRQEVRPKRYRTCSSSSPANDHPRRGQTANYYRNSLQLGERAGTAFMRFGRYHAADHQRHKDGLFNEWCRERSMLEK